MTSPPSRDCLLSLVRELRRLPQETDWLEFKANHNAPQDVGEYISAPSNAAALADGRGSGIDRVVSEIEQRQLPAPLFEATPRSTRAAISRGPGRFPSGRRP